MEKIFIGVFKSGWLGGHAIIEARNEDEALKYLNERHFKKLKKEDVKFRQREPEDGAIIYYDDGDY